MAITVFKHRFSSNQPSIQRSDLSGALTNHTLPQSQCRKQAQLKEESRLVCGSPKDRTADALLSVAMRLHTHKEGKILERQVTLGDRIDVNGPQLAGLLARAPAVVPNNKVSLVAGEIRPYTINLRTLSIILCF